MAEDLTAQDETYLHLAMPTMGVNYHAYVSLKNTATDENLSVKAAGSKSGLGEVDLMSFDFSSQLDLIIGEYDMTLGVVAPDGT